MSDLPLKFSVFWDSGNEILLSNCKAVWRVIGTLAKASNILPSSFAEEVQSLINNCCHIYDLCETAEDTGPDSGGSYNPHSLHHVPQAPQDHSWDSAVTRQGPNLLGEERWPPPHTELEAARKAAIPQSN